MNDKISNAVARWLSHPTGIFQSVVISAAWFSTPWIFQWKENSVIFWYLAYCTFISYATQFTLAYQNKKAELHMLNTMRLLVALAEEAKSEQVEIGRELDEITYRIKEDHPSIPLSPASPATTDPGQA